MRTPRYGSPRRRFAHETHDDDFHRRSGDDPTGRGPCAKRAAAGFTSAATVHATAAVAATIGETGAAVADHRGDRLGHTAHRRGDALAGDGDFGRPDP